MSIAIVGLGYVGTVTAACLAGSGHRVVGVDVAAAKVESFARGESPVSEDGVEQLLADGLAAGRVEATTDIEQAVATTDLALICVGTPSRANGDIDLSHIETVIGQIGAALSDRPTDKPYTVVIRSTVMPGTAERAAGILEQTSGRRLGHGLGLAVNPEFLREGQGVADFLDPPLVLVGSDDEVTASAILALYEGIEAERLVVPTRVAELIKYANNSWHATKVTFANEIGALAKSLGVDGRAVMDVVCRDDKLNISTAYLRPGFAFGGSCLPKDVRALNFAAKDHDVSTPLLASLLTSNAIQIQRLIDRLVSWDGRRIGFAGLAFKAGTDDLRESPMVEVVERMLGKGYECVIHDDDLSAGDLVGSNRAYIDAEIPHLSRLLTNDVGDLVERCDVVVVSKTSPELERALGDAAGRDPNRSGDGAEGDRSPGADRRDSGRPRVADLVGLPATITAGLDTDGVAW